MDLKRDLVKYVRDKAKSGYKKDTQCFICGETENLEFHHFYGLTELLDSWLKSNEITVKTVDQIKRLHYAKLTTGGSTVFMVKDLN